MKRPPGPWLFCVAGLLFLSVQYSEAVRATSLIFAKTTTTTTTVAPSAEGDVLPGDATEAPVLEVNNTATKPPLTGIPQIDYIYDPNLPRELNGYNLTDYPFYDRLPEDIDFKCDGLHDGFYASVAHKCQVYHHCLFGTRFDFLCANFTAFDQKTFICHFVSEVDCVNSPKFWHRNDALYKATTTTTLKPKIAATYPPPEGSFLRRPQGGNAGGGTGGRRRRPMRRRRPQYEEYYDEVEEYDQEYDDEPRGSNARRRKRPSRPRRPQYEDEEYDDYEDQRYDRRREYDRRGSDDRHEDRRRNKDRQRPAEDDIEDKERDRDREQVRDRDRDRNRDSYEDDRRDERRPDGKRPSGEGRRNRPKDDRRRPTGSGGDRNRRPSAVDESDDYDSKSRNKPPRKHKDDYDEDDRRGYDRPNRKNTKNDSTASDTKSSEERDRSDRDRPRKGSSKDDALGEDRPRDRERDRDRPRKNYNDKNPTDEPRPRENENKKVVVPNTGSSVYDKPRVPPIIRRPVPISEQEKYAYKTTKSTTKKPADDDYYYDDEEEADHRPPPPPPSKTKLGRPHNEEKRSSGSRMRPREPELEDERVEESRTTSKNVQKNKPRKSPTFTTTTTPAPSAEEEYYDEYEETKEVKSDEKYYKPEAKITTTTAKTPQPPPVPSTEAPPQKSTQKEGQTMVVRVHKRPFLPSRGGNPYAARGLQPVGIKAIPKELEEKPLEEEIIKKNRNRDSIPIYEEEKEQIRKEEPEEPRGPKVTLRTYSEEKPRIYSSIPDDKNFRPSPPLLKLADRPTSLNPQDKPRQQISKTTLPQTNYPNVQKVTVNTYKTITTPKSKLQEPRNPLDINENEYDVTLNDALNPTLPNLPVRGYPTGFSSVNDYTWAAFQPNRNRYTPTAAESYKVQQTTPIRPQNKFVSPSSPGDLFPSGSGQIKSYQVQNFRQTTRQTPQYYSIF